LSDEARDAFVEARLALDEDRRVHELVDDGFDEPAVVASQHRRGDRIVRPAERRVRGYGHEADVEAFLLELLSDFQITIPEVGTIVAESPPIVILTSNRTRELHDALKRRCLYHWIGYPGIEQEVAIVKTRLPEVSDTLARKVVAAVNRLRDMELAKPPGVAETLDWVAALGVIGAQELDIDDARDTLGSVIKDRDDLDEVHNDLDAVVSNV
jgi:MoxR-like ATPase